MVKKDIWDEIERRDISDILFWIGMFILIGHIVLRILELI
jgi:hypothetical protein